jgi:hypothetical protein
MIFLIITKQQVGRPIVRANTVSVVNLLGAFQSPVNGLFNYPPMLVNVSAGFPYEVVAVLEDRHNRES